MEIRVNHLMSWVLESYMANCGELLEGYPWNVPPCWQSQVTGLLLSFQHAWASTAATRGNGSDQRDAVVNHGPPSFSIFFPESFWSLGSFGSQLPIPAPWPQHGTSRGSSQHRALRSWPGASTSRQPGWWVGELRLQAQLPKGPEFLVWTAAGASGLLQGVGWSESHLGLSPPKCPVLFGCQALRLAQGRPGAGAWEEDLGGGSGEPHALRDLEPLRLHPGGPHPSGGGRAHADAARDRCHPRDVAWEACHSGPSEPGLWKRLCLRNWWTDRTVQRCRHSLPCWQVGAHC